MSAVAQAQSVSIYHRSLRLVRDKFLLFLEEMLFEKRDLLKNFGGPARIRTGDRQVSRTRGYEPAALSVLQPEENLAELRALQECRSLNLILNVLESS